MALAIDASTPAVVTNSNNSTATIATASFTPPAGALLLIRWAGNSQGGVNPSTPTITDNRGVHLTYTLLDWQSRADTPTVDGQSATWWAVVSTSVAMTVTVTSGSASGSRVAAMHVTVITGQHATPIGAHGKLGSASTSSIAQNFTGTATSSQGFLCVADWSDAGAETAGTGCTLTNGGSASITGQISYAFMRRTSADGTNGGTTTLNSTLPGTSTALSWTYAEVVPASAGSQSITPGGIPSSEIVSSSPLTTTYTVNTNGITSQLSVGLSVVSFSVNPQGIVGSEVLGNPSITTITTVNANGVPSAERLGLPAITTTYTINANGIPTSENIGNPNTITATSVAVHGIPSAGGLGGPAVTTTYTINAQGISSSESLGALAIARTIAVNGITSSEILGSPSVTVITAINAGSVSSNETFGNTTVLSTYTINANGITSATNLGNANVASATIITPGSITSSERLGAITITTGSVTVQVNGITSEQRVGDTMVSLGAPGSTIQAYGITSEVILGRPFVGPQADNIVTWREEMYVIYVQDETIEAIGGIEEI